MTNAWLMRRAVRRPPSRDTTAPISSSVSKLPFIRHSARPSRTSATALAAESWLCSASTSSKPEMLMRLFSAAAPMRAFGPTRIGLISPSFAGSTEPPGDESSHGWATAVGTGGYAFARSSSRSYFSCLRSMAVLSFLCDQRLRPARRRRREHGAGGAPHGELLLAGSFAMDARIGEQPLEQRQKPLAIRRLCQQFGKRGQRLFAVAAHEHFLRAADPARLVARQIGNERRIVAHQLLLELQARKRQRLAFARQQERDARQGLRVAALPRRRQRRFEEIGRCRAAL